MDAGALALGTLARMTVRVTQLVSSECARALFEAGKQGRGHEASLSSFPLSSPLTDEAATSADPSVDQPSPQASEGTGSRSGPSS